MKMFGQLKILCSFATENKHNPTQMTNSFANFWWWQSSELKNCE